MPEGTEGTTDTKTTEPGSKSTESTSTAPASTADTAKGKAPEWDGDFNPERAARLVANLREDLAKRDADLKTLREQIGAKGDTEKSLQDRLAALESRAEKAERDLLVATAAKAHGIPEDLVSFLTAKTAEDLDAQAKALAAHVKAPADDVPGKPKPKLTPGHAPDNDTTGFDPHKVAEAIRRR